VRKPEFRDILGVMTAAAKRPGATPVALTDDVTAMAAYVSSPEGRVAIKRGQADLREGRTIGGKDALATELNRRAAARRT
jgi:hypothetical protein